MKNLKNHLRDSNSDLMLEVQANSPYNDGWTQQFYREQLEEKQSKTMSKTIDSEKYVDFVRQVTSAPSLDYPVLSARFAALEANGANVPQLATAAMGLGAEAGEFTEIVKKIFFQGKPYDEANVEHMKIELGDCLWYIAQACMALDVSFDELMEMNFKKLTKRYPEGAFDIYRSENRAEGDL